MKIYISHSRKYDFKKELYEPIVNSQLSQDHEFVLPHAESDEPFDSRELLQSKTCDVVIAEVSLPATGQGIELGWANMLNIPIVCLYKQGVEISGSLSVVSNKFLMYTDPENMIQDITRVLKTYETND